MKTKFNLIDLQYLEFKGLNLKLKEMFSLFFFLQNQGLICTIKEKVHAHFLFWTLNFFYSDLIPLHWFHLGLDLVVCYGCLDMKFLQY